jgi:hypothetical protein
MSVTLIKFDIFPTDHKALPTLNRIPGLKLSGQAFADTLMVFEFLHNFGETLGFGECSCKKVHLFIFIPDGVYIYLSVFAICSLV